MPRWFYNLPGGVGADLITSMSYNSTVQQDLTYAIGMTTMTGINENSAMGKTYPETITTPLFNKNQVGVGLLGNTFSPSLQTQYNLVKAAGLKFIAVWDITPPGSGCLVASSMPKKCIQGAYTIQL